MPPLRLRSQCIISGGSRKCPDGVATVGMCRFSLARVPGCCSSASQIRPLLRSAEPYRLERGAADYLNGTFARLQLGAVTDNFATTSHKVDYVSGVRTAGFPAVDFAKAAHDELGSADQHVDQLVLLLWLLGSELGCPSGTILFAISEQLKWALRPGPGSAVKHN